MSTALPVRSDAAGTPAAGFQRDLRELRVLCVFVAVLTHLPGVSV
jgi:hypothetical protein